MKPHWYLLVISECPACHKDTGSHKVRQYSKRPEGYADRLKFVTPYEAYCGCIG